MACKTKPDFLRVMSAPGGVAIYLNSAHRDLSSERPMPAIISSGYIRLFKECAVEKCLFDFYLLFKTL